MRKIDIHCHTTRSPLKNIIPKAASIDVIEAAMRQHDIEITVLLATYFPNDGKGISNYRLLHWINQNPAFKLFGSLDFHYYFNSGIKELAELADERLLAGIKVYAGYQTIDYDSHEFKKVCDIANKYHLPMMFHGGFLQCHETNRCNAVNPKQLTQAAKYCESTSVIISHLAWPYINEIIAMTKSYDNVYADMSGMINSVETADTLTSCAEGITRFVDACGPERLLFGTDFPIQTHEDSIKLVELGLSNYTDKDKELVYYHNAKKLLDRVNT